MILYHFTLEEYVESIRQEGVLSIAEKIRRGMCPPGWKPSCKFPKENDLVWLTREPDTDAGLAGCRATAVKNPRLYRNGPIWRVMCDIPNAIHWSTAVPRYAVPPDWLMSMIGAAALINPLNKVSDWYVVEDIIPAEAILSIDPFNHLPIVH